MATLEEDDFTFPAAVAGSDLPPHFIESPPLWRQPTTADEKHDKLKGKEAEDDDEKSELCSFQDQFKKSSNCNEDEDEDEDEEEKMDVLWENLNDESLRNGLKISEKCDVSSSLTGCAKSLRLSRANGHMFSGKKPIILVFIKVMKKVLLMQNSNRIKKQAW